MEASKSTTKWGCDRTGVCCLACWRLSRMKRWMKWEHLQLPEYFCPQSLRSFHDIQRSQLDTFLYSLLVPTALNISIGTWHGKRIYRAIISLGWPRLIRWRVFAAGRLDSINHFLIIIRYLVFIWLKKFCLQKSFNEKVAKKIALPHQINFRVHILISWLLAVWLGSWMSTWWAKGMKKGILHWGWIGWIVADQFEKVCSVKLLTHHVE